MSIITLLVLVALIGLAVWALTTLIPMPPQFRTALIVIGLVLVILMVLNAFGLLDGIGTMRVGAPRVGR